MSDFVTPNRSDQGTRPTRRVQLLPPGFCLTCGHHEDAHMLDEEGQPTVCDVEVSDYGAMDCQCPGNRHDMEARYELVRRSETSHEGEVTTNRGGTAPTARPTAQEVDAPMRAQRTYSHWYWFKWRLARLVHPEAVCDAWYRQDCPPMCRFDWSARERVGWRLSMWLRESKTWHGWVEA